MAPEAVEANLAVETNLAEDMKHVGALTEKLIENIKNQALVNDAMVSRLLALEHRVEHSSKLEERLEEVRRRIDALWEALLDHDASVAVAGRAGEARIGGPLKSCLCTETQLHTPWFRRWLAKMGMEFRMHRKLWELCYIAQALSEREAFGVGKRGLGFAVGAEPLPALFAGLGCGILATDQDRVAAEASGWVSTNQHAQSLASLQRPEICAPDLFAERVSFANVDMNAIPQELRRGEFDFVWSCCSLEHLGSIERGIEFVLNAMDCLRPGGVAVHTTEYNISSDYDTVDNTGTVIYRRQDVQRLADALTARGHEITLDFDTGRGFADHYVDLPPYKQDIHLRLQISGYTTTSIGWIIRKSS
jgi:SAM-dependent methyltransferase